MSVDLAKINNIEGVVDSLIYSRIGTLLLPQLQYVDNRIMQLGKEIALSAALLEKIKQTVEFIESVYHDRRLIARITRDYFILVICDINADITLIRLTINVINEVIKDDKEIQRLLKKSPAKKDLIADASGDADLKALFARMKISV
jgi:hypothetical protein